MANDWEIACKSKECWPEGFIFIDQNGYLMPDMNSNKNLQGQNIFNYLVSNWDQKALRHAMKNAAESLPQFIMISLQFLGGSSNYRCQVFRSGKRFFIGGCREACELSVFPPSQALPV